MRSPGGGRIRSRSTSHARLTLHKCWHWSSQATKDRGSLGGNVLLTSLVPVSSPIHVTHLLLTKEENYWLTNIYLPTILIYGTGETKDFTDKRQKQKAPHKSHTAAKGIRPVLQMSPAISLL